MCGIAGLIHRDGATNVGKEMTAMLKSLKHRGPDSTGLCRLRRLRPQRICHAPQARRAGGHDARTTASAQKIRERQAEVDQRLAELGAETVESAEATEYAFRYRLRYAGDTRRLTHRDRADRGGRGPLVRLGARADQGPWAMRQVVSSNTGSAASGARTASATRAWRPNRTSIFRSAHPYWAYPYNDIAVVHNGQITNYWIMRREMERLGHRFMSNCDPELLAVYTANNLEKGATLEDSLKASIKDIDGVFTYVVATENELGMAKDTMAAKPMVLYESDNLVALASEEVAIRAIMPREIDTFDPYDEESAYGRDSATSSSEQERRSYEMGLHTEQLKGRSQQRFFDVDLKKPSTSLCRTPTTSISTSAPRSTPRRSRPQPINLRIRELMEDGYGTIVVHNPGAKHSIAVGILNRLNLIIDGSLGYFGVRPDRRAECAHRGPGRLVLRREHDERHDPDREERRLAVRRGHPRRRSRLHAAMSARAPAST